ncbi:MAG: prolipoprotein diacylglyceryl transferase [Bacteroidetes bacterium 4484_276]|nr:MAG: prolipoprotein diacylglyceryl transferase [Bacteroidetes bacterium 4484_276]
MLLNYIEWNVNPELFPGTWLPVRWYGLLFASSFFFGYLILMRVFKHEKLPVNLLDQLATYMVISTIIGARLGHILFYEPAFYLNKPLEILKIWNGGLASHGAAIGIMVGLYLYSLKNKMPYFWVLDRIAIVVALAGFFIRLGNLMNSEILGEPTTLPWAFIFVKISDIPRHPTQIYEAFSYLAIFGYLYWYYWKTDGKPKPGLISGIFLILLFAVRFLIEFLKEPQVNFESSMALNMGQLLSLPLILLGFYFVLRKSGPKIRTR